MTYENEEETLQTEGRIRGPVFRTGLEEVNSGYNDFGGGVKSSGRPSRPHDNV